METRSVVPSDALATRLPVCSHVLATTVKIIVVL
jgi:hypothetical protein